MSGFLVQPGAPAARAGAVERASGQIGDVVAAVRGVAGGDLPPKTGAALESALARWPGSLRRLATALDRTAAALRQADSAYAATDAAAGRAAGGR
jgi:uncharacterized protein YukE